jgi:hypothetical protein
LLISAALRISTSHHAPKSYLLHSSSRFGAYYDGLAVEDEKELLLFTKRKLLNGKSTLDSADEAGSFACLSARFPLEFNTSPVSYAVARTQAERHMRLILQADPAFQNEVTTVASEPLLAEAALELFKQSLANPVHHLAYHPDLSTVDRGQPGEMVAALIIMQARDASLAASVIERRWVPVSDFMQALLPPSAFKTLLCSLPTFWREGELKTFEETFRDYAVWFNHIIRVGTGEMMKAEHLWKFITRGAMIMCPVKYGGVDIVLPVCLAKGNLSRDTVTAILIQVKTSDLFQCSINNFCFDEMDPSLLVFSEGQSPRPIIRVVLALGSHEAGILIRSPRDSESEHRGSDSDRHNGSDSEHLDGLDSEHDCSDDSDDDKSNYQGDFTSFDIWCAGLSPDTFKDIGGDLAAYKVLLDRSLRSRISEAVELMDDLTLNDETKGARVTSRRRMRAMNYPES